MAAHTATAQRELGDIILDALGPRTTIGNIKGARNMLAMMHHALPVYPVRV